MSRKLVINGAVPRHHFAELSVVFCPHSGRTHAIDPDAVEIIDLIPPKKPTDEELLISNMVSRYPEDDEALLSSYIRDIINNLIELEIVCETQ